MSLKEYLRIPHKYIELINDEVEVLYGNTAGHAFMKHNLFHHFHAYFEGIGSGEIHMGGGYIVGSEIHDWVMCARVPTLVVHIGNRLKDYLSSTPNWRELPLYLVPDLTVEIVTHLQQPTDIDRKVTADLANGVRVVWVIDMTTQLAQVHTEEGIIRIPANGQLSAPTLLPEFVLSLPELFAE